MDKINVSGLEINISEKCNLKCKGCDHGMDIIAPKIIPLSKLLQDVTKASEFIHAKSLRIIGGEPLLHPELSKVIFEFFKVKIADSIELWTNGLLLKDVSKRNWEFIDGIVISKYPGINYSFDMTLLEELSNKFNLWFNIRDSKTFFWSMGSKRHSFKTASFLHNSCRELSTCNTIRDGKFYKCVQSAFAKERLNNYGIELNDDGVSLYKDSMGLIKRINNHIWSNTPLNTCYYCLGEYGDQFQHQQKKSSSSNNNIVSFSPDFILPE